MGRGRKIVLPGGSGFLGRTLAKWFCDKGDDVVILSRSPVSIPHGRVTVWDARTLGDWARELDGAHAVINLTGRSVNCRYTRANRRQMMHSRTDSTRILGKAMATCVRPPEFWANSSTATIYRHRFDTANDEKTGLYGAEPEAKDAYSLEVATAWEASFHEAYREHGLDETRGVLLRTAMVIGAEKGGVFQVLRRLTKLGLGGKMASGEQYVSWLHALDFCRITEWLMDNEKATGVYNLTAPNPVTNQEMMAMFREQFRRPIGLPATRWMLEIGAFMMRTETELILKSRRVVPKRLIDEGYRFAFSELPVALRDLAET